MNKVLKDALHGESYQAALADAYQKWDRIVQRIEDLDKNDVYVMGLEPCSLCSESAELGKDVDYEWRNSLKARCLCVLDRPRQVRWTYGCISHFGDVLDGESRDKQLRAAKKLRAVIASYMD